MQFERIDTNNIILNCAVAGYGPLMIFCHGFPESWYSWRHQMAYFADKGYRVVAPEMRGYGESSQPSSIDSYDQVTITADIVGIVDHFGEDTAIIVGHDWGAPTAYHCALLYPDRFSKVVALSVPYGGRPSTTPLDGFKYLFKDQFFYMLYFQEPGVAEAELAPQIANFLQKFYLGISGDITDYPMFHKYPRDATLMQTQTRQNDLPSFLTEQDLAYYVERFNKSGLSGPLNYYRNFDKTWRKTAHLADKKITQPCLFIAGSKEPMTKIGNQLANMQNACANLELHILEGYGHWLQQEAPSEVNSLIYNFLST